MRKRRAPRAGTPGQRVPPAPRDARCARPSRGPRPLSSGLSCLHGDEHGGEAACGSVGASLGLLAEAQRRGVRYARGRLLYGGANGARPLLSDHDDERRCAAAAEATRSSQGLAAQSAFPHLRCALCARGSKAVRHVRHGYDRETRGNGRAREHDARRARRSGQQLYPHGT